jgi:prepilin-type N-terminal cleavage/methylation domain-containing protein
MRRGFTLLELLVAATLAATLLFMTAHVFATAFRSRDRLQEVQRDIGGLRRAHEVIARDLHSAIVPPDDSGLQFGLTATDASLGANVLQFAAIVGDPLLAGRESNETALVQYAIAPDPRSGRPTLWRYETAYPVPEGTDPAAAEDARPLPLLAGVVGANYLFYSPSQATWVETWEGETGLPSAIRIDLALGDGTEEAGAPLRQESWTFSLPAAKYAADQAAAAEEEAAAAENGGTGATP